ncbi:matrixin family metalloprotease [Sphingomonas piscis]|uniref:Matrixin family metalloprotease n=1 Tax=Sphingomonas piscis TaxID=2714943 RepID=A0A6G7YR27_9SPHN|nr:M10 family metallopeptidase C-terminal domain-containing protein [Sphingomonas piscis]QIK79187.1 matrixin family metalloprotease [Sphingomonas piscis]
MVDVPGDGSTTSTIGIGDTVAGTIETAGDHDWYRITLTAGQRIEVQMTIAGGTPMEDPFLRIRDSSGQELASNDDGGDGRSARIGFEATRSGTYYIDASAWEPDSPTPGYTGTGTYQLAVKNYVAPSAWNNDQISNQLTSGYWEGDAHHFNVTQGGSLTVDLQGLGSNAQVLAREALGLWGDTIGVTFREVSGGAQITFDDNDEGASTSDQWNGGIISSAKINVASDWAPNSGSGLNSYLFQTFIHEIGHALGLGHAGDYNEEAKYPFDASYSNDGWPITVMSYFSQGESSYYSSRNFSGVYVVTPMVADVMGMATLYGLSTTTRTGNTVYGIANSAYGTMADRQVYDAARFPNVAVTVFDSGGTDTLNYASFSSSQRIDLNPEAFSNVAGLTGNLSIARGVTIENAIGGSGGDSLIGNGAGNLLVGNGGADNIQGNDGDDVLTGGSGSDTLSGGGGADVFADSRGNLNGDTITDFLVGDRLRFTDATSGSFTYSLSGSVLTFTGGTLTFSNSVSGTLLSEAASGGGVDLYFSGASSPGTGTGSGTGTGTGTGTGAGTGTGSTISGSGGADHLVGTSLGDTLRGFDGDDRISGGAGADVLDGGNGGDFISADAENSFDNLREVDQIFGGAGNDMIFSGYGDIVDGGAGFDTIGLSYVGATAGIDGDTRVLHAGQALVAGAGTFQNVERFSDIALTAYNDRMVIGDQHDPAVVRSWDGDDYLIGQEVSITMYGGNGNDMLVGSTSGDVLYGETGNDTLMGYLGSDELWGGSGADRFMVTRLNTTARIGDFERGSDKLDVSSLDANSGAGGDQAFAFIGSANFSGSAGELRYFGSGAGYSVEGDVNGDRVADFLITLGSVANVSASDFML